MKQYLDALGGIVPIFNYMVSHLNIIIIKGIRITTTTTTIIIIIS